MRTSIKQYPALEEIKKEFLTLWPRIEDARKHNNRALLVDLTKPFMNKLSAYVSREGITEEEEITCKQVIRKLKVYLINAFWGRSEKEETLKVDQGKSGNEVDNIDYLMQEIVGGGLFHENPSSERGVDMRDVKIYPDQKNTMNSDHFPLDIPFHLCNNGPGVELEDGAQKTPPTNPESFGSAPFTEDGPFSIEDFLPSGSRVVDPEPEITLVDALREMIRIAEESE